MEEIRILIGKIYMVIDSYNYNMKLVEAEAKKIPQADLIGFILDPIRLEIDAFFK